MTKRLVVISTSVLIGALVVACSHDHNDMSDGDKAVEGTPGATTNQASGYDSSDPSHYHPQSDDTKQYHPANSADVQPAAH